MCPGLYGHSRLSRVVEALVCGWCSVNDRGINKCTDYDRGINKCTDSCVTLKRHWSQLFHWSSKAHFRACHLIILTARKFIFILCSQPNAIFKINGPHPFQRQSPLAMANVTPEKKKKNNYHRDFCIYYLIRHTWRSLWIIQWQPPSLSFPPDLESTN